MNKLSQALIAALLAFSFSVQAHDGHSDISEYTLIPVRDNIHMVSGIGGNIAVLSGEQGLVIVDNGFNNKAHALREALDDLGGSNKLQYIINTHFHGDHAEGNLSLGKQAPIIAHDNVLTRLSAPHGVPLFNMKSDAYPLEARPSLTYDKGIKLHINNEQLSLVHYPNGHTDGDSVVYFKTSNVVHMGDHYFNGFFPFVDLNGGGNVVQFAKNVAAIIAEIDNDTAVIPGHGALSNKAKLVAFHEMLEGTIAEVKAMKAKGYSLEKMQEKGLSKRWTAWTKGFILTPVWISFIDASL